MRIIPAVAAAMVALTAAAVAEDAAPPKPPFRQLIAAGYEVRNVSIIPKDQLVALGYAEDTPLLLVTLQRGTSVAVCQFAVVNWSQLAATSVDGTTQCDVMDAAAAPAATVAGPQAMAAPATSAPAPSTNTAAPASPSNKPGGRLSH